MAFTETFGGTTIYPSDVSYRSISLSANQELSWPLEVATSGNVVAQIMDVTPSAGGFTITMPPANEASPGETALFFNAGSFNFTVADNAGNTIVTITPGLAYQVYLRTNTTVAGTWRTTQFGAGTSSATAGSLVGAGIKAINTTLNQSMAVTSLSVNYTAGAADRSAAFLWTGGAGTITLPAASTVGNDWFFHIRNGGTGAISLATTGGELINGTATVDFNPGDSAIIVCDGTGYFTIGFGQAPEFLFDYVSIDLTSQSSPYTLAGSNLNRIAYQFSGTLTTNMQIIVPATIQQYWVGNFTTGGSYTLTVKTSAGTGVVVPRDARAILYCNGTNVVTADTGGISIPILVSQGGTGATNASSARTNLGATSIGNALFIAVDEATARNAIIAAKSGANSDITSLTGLTTPLSVPQGGTGAATFTANGLIYGSGTSALGVTAVGTTGQVLVGNTGGAPSWATLSGIGVTSFSAGTTGLTPSAATSGAITLAGTLVVANGGTGATTLTGYVKGSGTSALTASATIPATDISGGAALTKTDDTNVTLTLGGTPASALLAATSLTLGWSGQLSVARGGTGQSSYTDGQLLIGNSTGNTLTKATLTAGTNVSITNGAGAITINATDQFVGTVTSVSGTGTVSGLTLTGTVTTSGNLTLGGTLAVTASDFASQTAKTFLAAPNASAGVPSFRAIIPADVPTLNQNTTGTASNVTGTVAVTNGGTGATSLSSGYLLKGNGTSAVSASVVYDDGTNVGIGTSSVTPILAGKTLQIGDGTVLSALSLIGTGAGTTGDGYIASSADAFLVIARSATSLVLGTNNTPRITIDSSGNVGIGTSVSYGSRLAVVPASTPTTVAGANQIQIGEASANTGYRMQLGYLNNGANGYNGSIQVYDNGNPEDLILNGAGGNVGIGTTSPGSPLDVSSTTDGDTIRVSFPSAATGTTGGGIQFRAYTNSATLVEQGRIQTICTDGSASYGGAMRFMTAGSGTLTERMRIDSSGNIGIGTSSPAAKLEVTQNQAAFSYFDFYNTTASGGVVWRQIVRNIANSGTTSVDLAKIGSGFLINNNDTNAANFTAFGVGGSERMRIDSSGNVGIGTSSPGAALDVAKSSGSLWVRDGTTGNATIFMTAAGSSYAEIQGAKFGVNFDMPLVLQRQGGNVGIGTSSPAEKLSVAGAIRVHTASSAGFTVDAKGGLFDFVPASNNVRVGYVPGTSGVNTGILTFVVGSGSEAMRIDASGNVGIGTSSPTSISGYKAITLDAVTGTFTDYRENATLRLRVGGDTGSAFINGSSGILRLLTSDAERMRIDGSGNVGIGTSAPYNKLETAASGGATIGISNTASGAGILYGKLAFYSADAAGAYKEYGGQIRSYSGVGIDYGDLRLYTGNGAAAAERMRIDASGNVGIGASAPTTNLQIGDISAADATFQGRIKLEDTSGSLQSVGGLEFATSSFGAGYGWKINSIDSSGVHLVFGTRQNSANWSEMMRIDSSGNLLVGTTSFLVSASEKASFDCGSTNGLTTKTSGGASAWNYFAWNSATSGNNGFIEFGTEGSYTARGSITYNRGAGQVAYNVTSDARLKENIADAAEAGHKIDAMQVRQFDWKETGNHLDYGFIAQELIKVAPEAVYAPEDEEKMMAVDYSKLVPMLVKEIQSLRARVAQLEGN